MHREVDTLLRERLFNLFGEHALGSDLGECDLGYFVARGLDDLDRDFMALSSQQLSHMVRLPHCQLRTARSNAKIRHYLFGSFLGASAFRLKSRRIVSSRVVDSASRAADFNVV